MLIVLAKKTTDSYTDSIDDDPGNLLAAIVGAMYLLVASTTHDLRAGYSLLMEGPSAGHHAFALDLLIVYGIMILTAMTVLLLTSDDAASLVLNAVAVLFIADLVRIVAKVLVQPGNLCASLDPLDLLSLWCVDGTISPTESVQNHAFWPKHLQIPNCKYCYGC